MTAIVPARITKLRNVTKVEGDVAILICVAEGVPNPHMVFHKAGSPLAYKEGDNVSVACMKVGDR